MRLSVEFPLLSRCCEGQGRACQFRLSLLGKHSSRTTSEDARDQDMRISDDSCRTRIARLSEESQIAQVGTSGPRATRPPTGRYDKDKSVVVLIVLNGQCR